jgi:hypothetical protein
MFVGVAIYLASGAVACGLVEGFDKSDQDGELYAVAAIFGPIVIAGFLLWGLGHLTSKLVRLSR